MLPILATVTFYPHTDGDGGAKPAPLLTEEDVLSLLDSKHEGWKGDREGWVTLECRDIAWRAHYRRGRVLEVGWWGTLPRAPAWGGRGRAAVL